MRSIHQISSVRTPAILLAGALLAAACVHPSASTTPTVGGGAAAASMPPMGWNSWNKFGCNIDEQLMRETADAMVSSGMRDAGYRYLNIDDCWMAKERDARGRLVPDPQRFAHGIKALADYVHARGLKLGIYSSAGTYTCQKFPASLGHEETDARTFAEWGVDYLKYDNCYNEKRPAVQRYEAMGRALQATGRPMVFSLCEWGSNHPWTWGRTVGGTLWRTTGDIEDKWPSMISNLDQQIPIAGFSGPGAWNDPDMLEVGNGGMTDTEYRAHFSLWALLNAPLIAGNDLRSMSAATRAILTNRDVIAVDQDWGGRQGTRIRADSAHEVWMKPMSDGGIAVVLLNRGDQSAWIQAVPDALGLPVAPRYRARDLWAHADVLVGDTLRANVPSHGVAMFLLHVEH